MEIIKPNEIGAKISTLIAESRKVFTIVSPYIKISNWKKMMVNLERAVDRGVEISVFYREVKDEDLKVFRNLGIQLYHLPGLHAKLYFNEEECIVTSMNLYEYSDINTLEIGILYNGKDEYSKLLSYFDKYIMGNDQVVEEVIDPLENLQKFLESEYQDKEVTRSGNYLFSKNILPVVDVFFLEDQIRLKFPDKKIEKSIVYEIEREIKKIGKENSEISEPSGGYSYYIIFFAYEVLDHKLIAKDLDDLNNLLTPYISKKKAYYRKW